MNQEVIHQIVNIMIDLENITILIRAAKQNNHVYSNWGIV